MSADLLERASALRATVKRHKAAIAKHRAELREAAAVLATIEAECTRLGIGFELQPRRAHGVGDIHGQSDPTA